MTFVWSGHPGAPEGSRGELGPGSGTRELRLGESRLIARIARIAREGRLGAGLREALSGSIVRIARAQHGVQQRDPGLIPANRL